MKKNVLVKTKSSPNIEDASNQSSLKFFVTLLVFSYISCFATRSFPIYCLILVAYTAIALRLNNSQNLSFILITITLVPTNFLPLFNSELLRQLSPVNIIAVVFIAKNLLAKNLKSYGWIAFVSLVLAINMTVTIDWRWSISMSTRIIFFTLCLVMSTEDVRKIDWKLQIDTIVKLLSILAPFGLIEAFTNAKLLFSGSFGLPLFASLDQGSISSRTLLTFGQANVAAMVLATFFIVILYDGFILNNKSYWNNFILCLTGIDRKSVV